MDFKKLTQSKMGMKLLALFFVLALVFTAGQGLAQEEGSGQEQGQEQESYEEYQSEPQETDFSDEDLDKFAKSYVQIQEIQQEYSDELSQMEDEQEAQELQEKYTERMVDVVREEGLSVEEYNQIGQAMNSDNELREDIESRVEDMK
ncbi:MAG: DUF4168 domain-containing protein [Thermodesulfobacteriota bacterium]